MKALNTLLILFFAITLSNCKSNDSTSNLEEAKKAIE